GGLVGTDKIAVFAVAPVERDYIPSGVLYGVDDISDHSRGSREFARSPAVEQNIAHGVSCHRYGVEHVVYSGKRIINADKPRANSRDQPALGIFYKSDKLYRV